MKTSRILSAIGILMFTAFLFTPGKVDAVNWDDKESGGIIDLYVKEIQNDSFLSTQDLEFEYQNIVPPGAYTTVYPFKDESSRVSIGITAHEVVNDEIDEIINNQGLESEKFSNTVVYYYPQDQPEIDENGKAGWYDESRGWAFCGDTEFITRVYMLVLNEDVSETTLTMAERWSREALAKAISKSAECGVKVDENINTDITIELTELSGEVEVKTGENGTYVPAKVGDILGMGDYVATGFDSAATFEVNNFAVMTIQEMTTFSVSQLFYDGNLAETAIKLHNGVIKNVVTPPKEMRALFQIITPTVTTGVRGTEFDVYYDEIGNMTNVYVWEGSVDLTSEDESNSEILEAGSTALVGGNGEIIINEIDEDTVAQYDTIELSEIENLDDLLSLGVGVLVIGAGLCCGFPILLVILIFILVRRKKKKKAQETTIQASVNNEGPVQKV